MPCLPYLREDADQKVVHVVVQRGGRLHVLAGECRVYRIWSAVFTVSVSVVFTVSVSAVFTVSVSAMFTVSVSVVFTV